MSLIQYEQHLLFWWILDSWSTYSQGQPFLAWSAQFYTYCLLMATIHWLTCPPSHVPLLSSIDQCSCWGLTTYLHGSLASTEGLFKEWRLYWLVVVLAGEGHLGMESLEMLFVLQEDTTCLLWWGCWDLALTWVSPSEQVWRDYSQARGRVCSLGRLCFPDFFWIMRNSGSALAMVPGVPTETLIPWSS